MVAESDITAVAGKPALSSGQNIPKVPGQHLLHYSPATPIRLFDSKASLLAFAETQSNCAALLIGDGEIKNGRTYHLPNNPAKMAESLYDILHQVDSLNVAQLLIEMPPKQPEWLAIRDRLRRASYKPGPDI
jgi:L-threonylcarbamoyladenylate synthase